MGYNSFSPEAFKNLKPVLHGTWTANYTAAPDCSKPGGPCCGAAGNPCCGGAGNPCCGGGSDDGHGPDGGVLLPDKVVSTPQVLLSSSAGGAGPLPIISTSLSDPINIVSTTVNTCCLGTANNLISFTGIINIPLALALTLNFQIVRSSCIGGSTNVGPTFTFSEAVSIIGAEAFSFQFVDNNVAPGTYTYSVQLGTGTLVASAGVTITNAVLSVLSVADQNC